MPRRRSSLIMIDLFNYPLVAILCTGLVIILAATEFGRRLGMNANRKVKDDISTLEAAMLGLLALILGSRLRWLFLALTPGATPSCSKPMP